MINTE